MKRKAHVLVSAVLLASIMVTACSKGPVTEAETGADKPESPKGPVNISMMNIYNSEGLKPDDPFIKKIEELTNTKLDITWVPSTTYDEKLTVTLASGNLPDVILINSINSAVLNASESGMFWELGPYYKDYPHLSTVNKAALNNAHINGKLYSVIRPRGVARDGLIFRKDWLDNLNLKVPETVDEVYEMFRQFTYNDPDKNGKQDTYGYMDFKGTSYYKEIMMWFGAPNNWNIVDGKFIPAHETPEYQEGLKFMKKLYDEKLINPNFPIVDRDTARNDVLQSKAGSNLAAFDAVWPQVFAAKTVDPKAAYTVAAPINGKKGKRTSASLGYQGMFVIPKTTVKTEAKLREILKFFDDLRNPAISDQLMKMIVEDQKKPKNEQANTTWTLMLVDDSQMAPNNEGAMYDTIRSKLKETAAVAVTDPSVGFYSATQIEKGAELQTMIDDARTKFILGNINEEQWKAVLQQWRKGGGEKIAEELTVAYNKAKGK